MAANGTNIIYLESFVESTAPLAAELNRLLNTIKDLDIRVTDLRVRLKDMVNECLSKPSQALPRGRSSNDACDEVADLRKRIEEGHRMMLQWCEEKQSLANIAKTMVDTYVLRAEKYKTELASELNMDPTAAEESFLDEVLEANLSEDKVLPTLTRSREPTQDIKVEIKRERESRRDSSANLMAATAQPVAATPSWDTAPTGRGRQSAAGAGIGAAPGPPPGVSDAEWRQQQQLNALNITQQLGSFGVGKAETRATERKGAQTSGSALLGDKRHSGQFQDTSALSVPAAGDLGVPAGGAGVLDPAALVEIPYIPPIPPGYKTSASQPQGPGRLLQFSDIKDSLRGKMAELYWPDDKLWYLIEIQSVNCHTRKAQIMYVTGETEELDLNEIVKEGHMTLDIV